MKRILSFTALVLAAVFAGYLGSVAHTQTVIQQRPLSNLGLSEGVGYGTSYPTAANDGAGPIDGEVFILRDGGTSTPDFSVYSDADSDWMVPTVADKDQATSFLSDDADSYYGLRVPDGELTASQFWLPWGAGMFAGAASAEDALAGDLDMVCYRAYLPFPMTATEWVFYEFQVASAGASDFLGFAIYEDATAGAQLTEGASVYAADGAALVVDITDVTLKNGFYRFCGCQTDVSAQDWLAVAPEATVQAINDDTVGTEAAYAKAANDCTGNADAPATTGALTATAEAMFVGRLQSN